MLTKRRIAPALLGALMISMLPPAMAQGSYTPPGAQAAPAAPSSGGKGKMSESSSGTTVVTVPMVVLVPLEEQANPQLNNGCWVRLQDKEAMPGKGSDLITIMGRMHLPELKTASGIDWTHKADSITVGPGARARIYADENYQGKVAMLAPGQQVKDLQREFGFPQSIDSMRVDCTG